MLHFFISEMYSETKAEEVAKGIKGFMSRLYEFYHRVSDSTNSNQASNDTPLVNVDDVEKENGDKDFCTKMLLKFKKMKQKAHAEIKTKVDRYLLEPSEDPCDGKFDILDQ